MSNDEVEIMDIDADLKAFCERAVKLGATNATAIKAAEIFVAEWVRLKCQFGCDGWGQCLTCPPHSPTPETTRKVLAEYEWAILVHVAVEKGKRDWKSIRKIIPELEKDIFLKGYYATLGFASGPCYFCGDVCNLKECKHPELARPSMEAAGMDVYATARKAGFPIQVVKENDPQNYYGVVLVNSRAG